MIHFKKNANVLLNQNGFTLLELIVTLVIIGIILGFASLSLNNGGIEANLQQDAQRIAALIELAQEEAILQGSNRGLLITPTGFYFLAYSESGWQFFDKKEEIFYPRQWQNQWRINLQIEGEVIDLPTQLETTLPPHLYLLASGELMSFVLTLSAPSMAKIRYQVVSDNGYKIDVRREEENSL